MWGYSCFNPEFYDPETMNSDELDLSQPNRVKWFLDQGLSIDDVQSGECGAIVKTNDQSLYGMPFDLEQLNLDEDIAHYQLREMKAVNMIGGRD